MPPPPPRRDYWSINITWYPHHTHYRPWFGYVDIVYINNYPSYRWNGYDGAGASVNSVWELRNEKESLDWAFHDLNPQSPYYRDDTERVVNGYGYLLDQVFDWGNKHPHDSLFGNGEYQSLVQGIWNNIQAALGKYESWTGDSTLRHITMDALYHRVSGSWLAAERGFYGRLVEEIRTADSGYWN